MDNEFFTFGEYMKKEDSQLTASMEDYLEMIYRLSKDKDYTRVHDLAKALNIKQPSATNMMQKLADLHLVDYEKYGIITLTPNGQQLGQHLLKRHEIIQEFLKLLGITEGVHEVTEKIEHTINLETLNAFEDFVAFFNNHQEIIADFNCYRQQKI